MSRPPHPAEQPRSRHAHGRDGPAGRRRSSSGAIVYCKLRTSLPAFLPRNGDDHGTGRLPRKI